MLGWYTVKVMTSFGYETMLTRGWWFQRLDINKPWRQIPADRLLFLVFTHFLFSLFYFFFDYSEAIRRGDILFKSNQVIERNFEACKNVYLGSIFIPKKYVIRVLLVSPWTSLIPPLDIWVPPPPGSHGKWSGKNNKEDACQRSVVSGKHSTWKSLKGDVIV